MTINDVVALVLTDLDMVDPSNERKAQVTHLVNSAKAYMERNGISFGTDLSIEEADVMRMYAAWSFRNRATGAEMPRALRYHLNNLLLGQKAGAADGNA